MRPKLTTILLVALSIAIVLCARLVFEFINPWAGFATYGAAVIPLITIININNQKKK